MINSDLGARAGNGRLCGDAKALGIWLAAKPHIGNRTKIDRIGRKAPYFKKIFRKGDRLSELRRELDVLRVMNQMEQSLGLHQRLLVPRMR